MPGRTAGYSLHISKSPDGSGYASRRGRTYSCSTTPLLALTFLRSQRIFGSGERLPHGCVGFRGRFRIAAPDRGVFLAGARPFSGCAPQQWHARLGLYGVPGPGGISILPARGAAYPRPRRADWATTTPVQADQSAGPSNSRIDARNRIAEGFIRAAGVAIDDQHTLMTTLQDRHEDNVHYREHGVELMGEQAACMIQRTLTHPSEMDRLKGP
jgi:hypothetical protein